MVGNGVSECFTVNIGFRQGCVMFPWLFNVYMDGVVREVNARVLGKALELLSVRMVAGFRNKVGMQDTEANLTARKARVTGDTRAPQQEDLDVEILQ